MAKPTLARARALGAKIKTREQARATLKLTRQILRKAVAQLAGFSKLDLAFTKVHTAWVSRLEGQIRRVGVLQKRLAAAFNRKVSDAIGLAVLQSTYTLKQLRVAVKKSQNQSAIDGLLSDFADSMRKILAAAIETTAKAVPWYVWAVGLYLLTRRQPSREDLRPL